MWIRSSFARWTRWVWTNYCLCQQKSIKADYSSFKLELLARKVLKIFLWGSRITIVTDNTPPVHLQTATLRAVEQRGVAQLFWPDHQILIWERHSNVEVLCWLPFASTDRTATPNSGVLGTRWITWLSSEPVAPTTTKETVESFRVISGHKGGCVRESTRYTNSCNTKADCSP